MSVQGLRQAGLAVKEAENGLLDVAPAQLELQGLTGRLAAQSQHHNAVKRDLELQGRFCEVHLLSFCNARYSSRQMLSKEKLLTHNFGGGLCPAKAARPAWRLKPC